MTTVPVPLRARFARALVPVLASLLIAMTATGCTGGGSASKQITVTGSTTLLPIAEIAAESFHEDNADTKVLVSGVGSSAGIESVTKGSSDIGTSSRDLKEAEQTLGLVDTPVAYDAIAIIVNKSNPVEQVTMAQAKAIFQGRITNWRELGGPDMPIGLVNRDEASGTREAFFKIVLDEEPFDPSAAVLPGTGQVRSVVARSEGAVGYISLGFIDDSVKALTIDGVRPTVSSVVDGSYPVRRLLHFFTKGAPGPLAQRYIDYVLSDRIQTQVVKDAGFIPITAGAPGKEEPSE